MALAYLLDPCLQHQNREGVNNVAGWFEVFLNGTDDRAQVYSDFDGTLCPEHIVIDNNGRCVIIADSSKAYRVEMYGPNGDLIYTQYPVWCMESGDGAGDSTDVISTDGSIAIDKSVVGSTTTYDIGLAPRDNDEFLEWCKCADAGVGDGDLFPQYVEGSMETAAGQGLHVGKDKFYHITCTVKVDPAGDGINYETLVSKLVFNDGADHDLVTRKYDIDNSVTDPVLCEFSYDFKAPADGYLYLHLDGTSPFTQVDVDLQVHRVYSGINAVPDTCATKQWVQNTFDYNMAEKISYSALGYNASGDITAISGSSIAGGNIDFTAYVPWSASGAFAPSGDYAYNSSISSKADQSSLSAYQPVSAMSGYATEAYVGAAVGVKLDASASSLFLTSLPADLATTGDVASAVSGKLDGSASGEWYPRTGNPSGFLTAHQSLAGYATEQYVDSAVSSKLDTSAFASASSGFAPTGDYAYNSSLSSYYPASASGAFAPSGNYQTAGDYAFNSAVSAKLDASASSSFVVNSAMSSWIPYSALDYSGTAISGIGGSSLAGMGNGDYTGIYPVNVDNTAREISVDSLPLVTDSSLTAYGSAGSSVIGVNMDILSGKLDASASSSFQPSGDYAFNSALTAYQEVSGMSAYQEVSGMSAYQPSGDYIYVSALGWADIGG